MFVWVVDTIENNPSESLRYTYKEEDSIQQKIEKVATNIYGAAVITYSSIARNRIKLIEKMGITIIRFVLLKHNIHSLPIQRFMVR